MLPLDYVLALAVLIAPAGAETDCPPEHACIWRTIQSLALALEVMDPREANYVLARACHYESDLRLLRGRHADLADAPPATDIERFPTRQVASHLLGHNREFHRALCVRFGPQGHTEISQQAMTENDRRYKIWDAIRDARSDFYYIGVRRQALRQLRQLLGEPAYQAGDVPPATAGSLAD